MAISKGNKIRSSAHAWRRLIQNNPNDAEAMNELGDALAQTGRIEEGLQWFRRALEIQPNLSTAKANLGAALRHLGQFEEALYSLKDAIGSSPDDAFACFNLGMTLKSLQQLDEALTWLRTAFDLRPGHRDTAREIARVLQALKRNDEAIEAYRSALALKPDCIETLMSLGGLLQEAQAFRGGGRRLSIKSCRLILTTAMAGLVSAPHCSAPSDAPKSLAAFRRAVAFSQGSAVAYCNMSLALMDLGRLEEGIAACRKAIFIEPGSGSGHLQSRMHVIGASEIFAKAGRHTTTGSRWAPRSGYGKKLTRPLGLANPCTTDRSSFSGNRGTATTFSSVAIYPSSATSVPPFRM